MPHLLLLDGQIVRAAKTQCGILRKFSEMSGAHITNPHPPRGVVDADGNELGAQPPGLDAEDAWQVSVRGEIYSFHRFEREYRYYYFHAPPQRLYPDGGHAPEAPALYGHDHPARAMAAAAAALSPLVLATHPERALYESELRGLPPPLRRLGRADPGALRNPGPDWEHYAPGGETHRWIRAPRKHYAIVVAPDPLRALRTPRAPGAENAPFLWLEGYYDTSAVACALHEMEERWRSWLGEVPAYALEWGDDAAQAMNYAAAAIEQEFAEQNADAGEQVDVSHWLRALLRHAFLHPVPPDRFYAPHYLPCPEFAQALATLRDALL